MAAPQKGTLLLGRLLEVADFVGVWRRLDVKDPASRKILQAEAATVAENHRKMSRITLEKASVSGALKAKSRALHFS
jgi:hypothetical protein